MADEVLVSGLADLLSSEDIATEFLMLLADRDGSILTHPALFYAMGTAGNSAVVSVPHVGLGGYDLLSASTPGSEIANTALTDGSTNVTIAHRAKRYSVDDLAAVLSRGKLAFAQDAAIAVAQTLISAIANVGDDFTSTAGTSGVDAAWTDIIDAKTTLGIAKASGPMLGILHPRQWGDLEADALTIPGMAAMQVAGVINIGLEGTYKGRWAGIDFYVSSHVPTADAGANRAGAIFTRGGIAWADKAMVPESDPNILDLGRARFERVRAGNSLLTSYVTSYAMGVAKAIDAAGVTLKTDA